MLKYCEKKNNWSIGTLEIICGSEQFVPTLDMWLCQIVYITVLKDQYWCCIGNNKKRDTIKYFGFVSC